MIYTITHKKVQFTPPELKGYRMLQVGNGDKIYKLMDSVGDNIAEKNGTFCELTGLYWIWKNACDDSIVGLIHYRRFFVYPVWYKIAGRIPLSLRIISVRCAKRILEKYDIIVANQFKYGTSVWENYAKEHNEGDLIVLREIISEKYPDYVEDFDEYFAGNIMYGCNMFIAKNTFLPPYCEWLFNILFEAERKIDISKYDDYQKRVFGFLAERLFNVYLMHNKMTLYTALVDFIEN